MECWDFYNWGASVVQVYIPYLDIDLRPAEQLPDAEAKI